MYRDILLGGTVLLIAHLSMHYFLSLKFIISSEIFKKNLSFLSFKTGFSEGRLSTGTFTDEGSQVKLGTGMTFQVDRYDLAFEPGLWF